ncbi:alpha/beta fold hydrolase [Devosia sp.]|uniref:alpha/beta fold hydrolase n=1 Tax=Devosia sp. TaxID=1871048 RepID=UPI0035B30C24
MKLVDEPQLMILPGTLCDMQAFAEVQHLAGGLSAIHVEYSDADNAPEMASIILERAPRRISLCGFSLGGAVALEMIAQAPERIVRLALIGTNPGTMAPERVEANRTALELARARGCPTYITGVWEDSVPPARRDDRKLRATLNIMAASVPVPRFESQLLIGANRLDSRPRLAAINVPTLVVCGTEDRICPPALSIEMAAAIPNARLALVEGAGHYVTLEQPQAVADEIAAWLATPATIMH